MFQLLANGEPSTLGSYRRVCACALGEDCAPVKFFDKKIAHSPIGEDEPVIADESQMLALILHLFFKEKEH